MFDAYADAIQAAQRLSIHPETVKRLIREGKLPASKFGRKWLIRRDELEQFASGYTPQVGRPRNLFSAIKEIPVEYTAPVDRLSSINWDFPDAKTGDFTHGFHPYPAKFIPQIPRHLIELLSEPGERVLDPFCGSGTALVEAIIAGREAVGIDINPLSALIAKVKATPLTEEQMSKIAQVVAAIGNDIDRLYQSPTLFVNHDGQVPDYPTPDFPKLTFWFKDFVIRELALIKHHIINDLTDTNVKDFLKVALSAIIVTVSNQDSDTRYVRREKKTAPGDTHQAFARKAASMQKGMRALRQRAGERRAEVHVADAQLLDQVLEADSAHLCVTSPPYPNAFSYHLYHRNRLYWLDMDPHELKRKEIGSHRKYSAPNGATSETFRQEMSHCFTGIYHTLIPGRYFCILIGDSIIRGTKVNNSELLIDVAENTGFELVREIRRTIHSNRKAFNPAIGNIKAESLLVFRSI